MFLKFKEKPYVVYGHFWQRKIRVSRIAQVKIPQLVGLADVDQKHQGRSETSRSEHSNS